MAWVEEKIERELWDNTDMSFSSTNTVTWSNLLGGVWTVESNDTEQKGHMLDDTLKTTLIGGSSAGVILTGWLPDAVAVAVGILTALHLSIKIVKEFNK